MLNIFTNRSMDGNRLLISSADGYCSMMQFDQGELGPRLEQAPVAVASAPKIPVSGQLDAGIILLADGPFLRNLLMLLLPNLHRLNGRTKRLLVARPLPRSKNRLLLRLREFPADKSALLRSLTLRNQRARLPRRRLLRHRTPPPVQPASRYPRKRSGGSHRR